MWTLLTILLKYYHILIRLLVETSSFIKIVKKENLFLTSLSKLLCWLKTKKIWKKPQTILPITSSMQNSISVRNSSCTFFKIDHSIPHSPSSRSSLDPNLSLSSKETSRLTYSQDQKYQKQTFTQTKWQNYSTNVLSMEINDAIVRNAIVFVEIVKVPN